MSTSITRGVGRTGILLAGVVVAAGAVLYHSSQTDAGPVDPAKLLQCAGSRFVSGDVLQGADIPETATPEQLAQRYAAAMARERSINAAMTHRVVYRSTARTDIAVSADGRTIAVLSYEKHDRLGWRLESTVECG